MSEEKKKVVFQSGKRRHQEPKQDLSPYSGREIDPKNLNQDPIFRSWFYDVLSKGIPLPENHPISYVVDLQIKVMKYFVVYVRNASDSMAISDESRSDICFWQQGGRLNIKDQQKELSQIIQTQFSSLAPLLNISILINMNQYDTLQNLIHIKKRQSNMRMVFHYIDHDVTQNFSDRLNFPQNVPLPLCDLLENAGSLPIFIYDRDNAGALLNTVIQYFQRKQEDNLNQFNNNNNSNNNSNNSFFGGNNNSNCNNKMNNLQQFDEHVHFFSCSAGEMMPRSSDYPIDLFTSCLTSPARVALIWHSRHYFCFQSGCLQTLSTLFIEEMETDDQEKKRIESILDELKSALRATVETMALENMDPLLFVKMFRTDSTLSELCVNFILAYRILNFFNVHPVSYPEFPDLNECGHWQTFDLRLDAALFLLKNKPQILPSPLSYHIFLKQCLETMKNFVELFSSGDDLDLSEFSSRKPFELSFFPDILNDKELRNDACNVLAKYLDSSAEAVYYSLYFPIPKALFNMLVSFSNKKINNSKNLDNENDANFINHSFCKSITRNNLALNNITNDNIICNKITTNKLTSNNFMNNNIINYKNNNLYECANDSYNDISMNDNDINENDINDFDNNDNGSSDLSISPSLIFSIIKILSYYRDVHVSLLDKNSNVIEKVLPLLSDSKCKNLIVILLALLTRDTAAPTFKSMLSRPEELTKLKFDNFSDDSKMWLLRFISYAVPSISDFSLIGELLQLIIQLSEGAQPELQITMISTLSGFIKVQAKMCRKENSQTIKRRKPIERKAVLTAMEFADSASFIVRRELLIMLKKYRDTHQTQLEKGFEEQKPFYRKITEFFRKCENDPNPLVRDALDNENPSFISDTYIATNLKSISPLMEKSVSLSEIFAIPKTENKTSSQSPVTAARAKQPTIVSKNFLMKTSSYYKHPNFITSNLCKITSVSSEYISFGDRSGNVIIKPWDETSLNPNSISNSSSNSNSNPAMCVKGLKVSDNPITDVQFSKNYGWPLLFSAASNGHCFVSSVDQNTNDMSVISSFQLSSLGRSSHFHLAVDDWKMRLYSYAFGESDEFQVRDLRADRVLQAIKPKCGPTNSLLVPKFEDTLAICGQSFEFYDLRVSCIEPQVFLKDDFESPPCMIQNLNETIPKYAVASNNSSVTMIDMRYPQGKRTSNLYFTNEQTNQSIKAFAAMNNECLINRNKASITAVSHFYGITFVDLENGKQESLPQIPKIGSKFANSTALLFHPRLYSLAFVHDETYIVNASSI